MDDNSEAKLVVKFVIAAIVFALSLKFGVDELFVGYVLGLAIQYTWQK